MIPVHTVAQDLGHEVSDVLPALHCVSGCDSTSKLRWMKTVSENPELIDGFKLLGIDTSVNEDVTKESCESLVSMMYGADKSTSLDQVRHNLFTKKNLSNDRFPPTCDTFCQHLSRVHIFELMQPNQR